MKRKNGSSGRESRFILGVMFLIFFGSSTLFSQSFDFPSKKWGISFGNSKEFTGLRFNFQDSQVRRITGINITLWKPKKDNEGARVRGLSLGVIPGGGYVHGIQLGVLGVAAEKNLVGLSIGLLGVGSGENVVGVNIGGLGAGAGESLTGINIGGFGVGAGKNLVGINIGGFGVGAGENLTGINIGGFGVGAGEDMKGLNIGLLGAGAGRDAAWINLGGFGVGAGRDMTGLNVGLFGVGAGRRLVGINIGGLGVGAGEKLIGLTIGGLGAGSEEVQGLTVGGLGVGGEALKGVQLALGTVIVPKGGRMIGFAASAFNYIRGTQTGLSIGIVNYCWRLKGVQIGLVNIVRDNPKYLKILPLINANF
jgi:hypothetical protein